MPFFRPLITLLRNFGMLIFFAILLIASLAGIVVNTPFPVNTIGSYQVAAFPSGLALYQQGDSQHFYSFSPLNDYLIDGRQIKSTILSPDVFNQKNFSTNLDLSFWQKAQLSFQNYFLQAPITFRVAGDTNATYTTTQHNQTLDITRTIERKVGETPLSIGSTLKINNDDFLFDAKGTLYVYQASQEITHFQQAYGMQLHFPDLQKITQTHNQVRIDSGKIIIHNPNLPGFLVVTKAPNQTMWFDFDNNLVELEEPIDYSAPQITSTIHVTIVPTFEQAKALAL